MNPLVPPSAHVRNPAPDSPAPTRLPPTAAGSESGKPAEDARARLLQAGLRLFAHQGYSKTSTRELAEAASVNVASISYYFGDKAGLYRAVFSEPLGSPEDDIARFADPGLTLPEALRGFYAGFLEPLKHGDGPRLCMKLHFREMLEPTGLWDADPTFGIKDQHEALLALLARHLGLAEGPGSAGCPVDPHADADLQRLALCLAGLGVHMHVGRDIADRLVPGINQGSAAIDLWAERLVMFALAMVHAEAQRRGTPLSGVAHP